MLFGSASVARREEVVHLVVQHDAAPGAHDLRPEGEVHGRREPDRELAGDGTDVLGSVVVRERPRHPVVLGVERALGIERRADRVQPRARQERRHRDLDPVRIPHELRAVGVGVLHRLREEMDVRRAARIHGREVVAFEDAEHLEEHGTAGRRRRHRLDAPAPVGADEWSAIPRGPGREILRREDPAVRLCGRDEVVRDPAPLELVAAVVHPGGDRASETRAPDAVALAHRGPREQRRLHRATAPFRGRRASGEVRTDRESSPRETERGCRDLSPREVPPARRRAQRALGPPRVSRCSRRPPPS